MWSDNETKQDLLGYQVHADLLKEVVLELPSFFCRALRK